jgi:hypothetical protein
VPAGGKGINGIGQRKELDCHDVSVKTPVKSMGVLKLGQFYKFLTNRLVQLSVKTALAGGMNLGEAAIFNWANAEKIDIQ